jgi:hypothetical protein
MQWIDNFDIKNIDNENIEEYTGLPFIKKNEIYEWAIDYVVFKSSRNLQSLILSFDLRYKGRILDGDFQEYGSTHQSYHLFRAIHQLLDIHIYTHYHPLFIPSGEFTFESIHIFSPNRDILQLFLKGIRICSSIDISDEHNYTDDENMFFHSRARD